MTQIKICGLKTRDAVQTAAEAGIDYIGFVFAESKRQVTPEDVLSITDSLQTPKRIGVFVDEPFDSMISIGKKARLDGYQLHGSESPELCLRLKENTGKQIWKAWQVRADKRDERVKEYNNLIDALLLDTYKPGIQGGTGQIFPWQTIAQFREWLPGVTIFVAGGLKVDNVGNLLTEFIPDGVDVSSGVETNGVKDTEKMKQFIKVVRERG